MLEKSVHVLSLKEKKPNYVVQYIVVDFFKSPNIGILYQSSSIGEDS